MRRRAYIHVATVIHNQQCGSCDAFFSCLKLGASWLIWQIDWGYTYTARRASELSISCAHMVGGPSPQFRPVVIQKILIWGHDRHLHVLIHCFIRNPFPLLELFTFFCLANLGGQIFFLSSFEQQT